MSSFNLAEKNGIHGYKIHSEDFFNSYFIEKVIKTKKPVIINLGGTHKSEVYNLLNFLNRKKLLSEKNFLNAWSSNISNTCRRSFFI